MEILQKIIGPKNQIDTTDSFHLNLIKKMASLLKYQLVSLFSTLSVRFSGQRRLVYSISLHISLYLY